MLARSLSAQTAAVVDRATLVLFTLDGVLFGAPVESVERVLRRTVDAADEDAPDWVCGSVTHAARRVPLLDARVRLAAPVAGSNAAAAAPHDHAFVNSVVNSVVNSASPATAESASSRVLVLARGTTWFAVRVDAVLEVATVDASLIRRADHGAAHILGELSRNDRRILVLDASRLLSANEWSVLQQRAQHSATPGAAR